MWLNTSLGDAHYLLDDFDTAAQFLWDALNCPDGFSNPFVHLRLGQCLLRARAGITSHLFARLHATFGGSSVADSST